MSKGMLSATLGAIAIAFACSWAMPAEACDVQLGRPNSCNQWCDGDYINGPEIISCADHIRRKRAAADRVEKARQDRIRETEIRRQKELEAQRAQAEAQREKERQNTLTQERQREIDRAAEEARNRKRQQDIDFARQELELKKQQLELADLDRRRKDETKSTNEGEGKSGKTVNTPLSIAMILSMIALGATVKKESYLYKFVSVAAVPAVTYGIKYFFGIEIEDKFTLAEIPLFAPAFGGMVVAALLYKA